MQTKIENFGDIAQLVKDILKFSFYNHNQKIEANKIWIYNIIDSKYFELDKILLKSFPLITSVEPIEKSKFELILKRKIKDLNFSIRLINCLENVGIIWVDELVGLNQYKLDRIRGLGKKTKLEINDFKKALKTQIGYEKYIKVNKSDNSNYWQEIVKAEIYDLNIKGFGTSKKRKLVNEIINSIRLTLKIHNSNYKK